MQAHKNGRGPQTGTRQTETGETTMFKRISGHALSLALLSLLLCLPARAQRIEIGTGVYCDTQKQVERFVTLFDGDAEKAMKTVNAEENDPTACIGGTIAFVRGPEVVTARTEKATFHIVRVLIVGLVTDDGELQAATPAAFFSAEQIDERIA
jgi:hypothetical protein